MACLLCQRQFKTLDILGRHCNASELHKARINFDCSRRLSPSNHSFPDMSRLANPFGYTFCLGLTTKYIRRCRKTSPTRQYAKLEESVKPPHRLTNRSQRRARRIFRLHYTATVRLSVDRCSINQRYLCPKRVAPRRSASLPKPRLRRRPSLLQDPLQVKISVTRAINC